MTHPNYQYWRKEEHIPDILNRVLIQLHTTYLERINHVRPIYGISQEASQGKAQGLSEAHTVDTR